MTSVHKQGAPFLGMAYMDGNEQTAGNISISRANLNGGMMILDPNWGDIISIEGASRRMESDVLGTGTATSADYVFRLHSHVCRLTCR